MLSFRADRLRILNGFYILSLFQISSIRAIFLWFSNELREGWTSDPWLTDVMSNEAEIDHDNGKYLIRLRIFEHKWISSCYFLKPHLCRLQLLALVLPNMYYYQLFQSSIVRSCFSFIDDSLITKIMNKSWSLHMQYAWAQMVVRLDVPCVWQSPDKANKIDKRSNDEARRCTNEVWANASINVSELLAHGVYQESCDVWSCRANVVI